MTWSHKLEKIMDVVLRVPPLFLMDCVLNRSFFSDFFVFHYSGAMTWMQCFQWISIMSTLFMLALVLFLLSAKQLMDIYSYILSILCLMNSYYWNINFILPIYSEEANQYWPEKKSLTDIINSNFYGFSQNIIMQIAMAYVFTAVWKFRKASRVYGTDGRLLVSFGLLLSFLFPVILRAVYQDFSIFLWSPLISMIFPFGIIAVDTWSSLSSVFWLFRRAYSIAVLTIETMGIQVFIENQWIRLHIPKVLRIFWILRLVFQFSYYYIVSVHEVHNTTGTMDYYDKIDFNSIFTNMASRSCDTIISLMGMTSLVSLIAHYLGIFLAFCVGSDSEEDKNMGTVSAILFFILGLQTGLTGLRPNDRLIRLCKNFCLLLTAISHFVHSMVHPLLMSLSASRSTNIVRHVRVLSMCMFLTTFPIFLLVYLWSNYNLSTWLLAVTAFSVEVMLKVLISLTVYCLFIFDAYRETFWEGLDDYVYYIQSTGNTIEFLFGIFLFCNGAWIMVFESGGAIRAVMMCIHAYFNIWMQAKEGWKVFMKRRTAVQKINSLPMASQEQLGKLNDVCAICYQELNSARITRCNHFFHGVCLRKWLYVQDNCPLCHELMYEKENIPSDKDETINQNNNQDLQPRRLNADQDEPAVQDFQQHMFAGNHQLAENLQVPLPVQENVLQDRYPNYVDFLPNNTDHNILNEPYFPPGGHIHQE